MASASSINEPQPSIILITGEPGVGKTTLLKNIYDKIKQNNSDINIKGFVTVDLRDESHSRIGFDIINLNDRNNKAALARLPQYLPPGITQPNMLPKVGRYSITLSSFEQIALPIINITEPNSILAIDEIGKMELLSERFKMSIRTLIQQANDNKIVLIATIPIAKGKLLDIVEELRTNPKSTLITVNHQNRNNMVEKMIALILNSFKLLKK